MYKDIAWNNFCKTGDINSYIEYSKLKNIGFIENNILNEEKLMQNSEVMIDEVNKSKGNSN